MWNISERALMELESGPHFRIDVELWAAGQPGARKLADLIVNDASLSADITRRVVWEGQFNVAAIDYYDQNIFALLDPELGCWLNVYYVIQYGEGYEERIPFPAQVVVEVDQPERGGEISVTTNSPERFVEDNTDGQDYMASEIDAFFAADSDNNPFYGDYRVSEIMAYAYRASCPKFFPTGVFTDTVNSPSLDDISTGYEYTSSPDSLGAYLDSLALGIKGRWFINRFNALQLDPNPTSAGSAAALFRTGVNSVITEKGRSKSRDGIFNRVNVDSMLTGTRTETDQVLLDAMGPKTFNDQIGVAYFSGFSTSSELINRLTNRRIATPIKALTYPHLDVGDTVSVNDVVDGVAESYMATVTKFQLDLNGKPSSYTVEDRTPVGLDDNAYTYQG